MSIGNKEAERKIRSLREKLHHHQQLYYIKAEPEISDSAYDKLFDELLALEGKYPEYKDPNSPTMRVGSDLSSDFPEVEHTIPVLSLDKAYSVTEVQNWLERTAKNLNRALDVVIEEKIDGVSIVLYYEEGALKQAVTRGNGKVGNDVTNNVKTIKAVPLHLPEEVNLVVRGEIFLPKSTFETFNKEAGNIYANPRNLAAGALRRLKSKETAHFPLRIFIYEGYFQDASLYKTHTAILQKLKELGFPLNHRGMVLSATATEKSVSESLPFPEAPLSFLREYIEKQEEEREHIDYEIDGLVIKLNTIALREDLGMTGHHPKWAIAYKFESPQAETTVENIRIQTGRSGRITPLAELSPVLLAGSTISKATLHNQAYIDQLELAIGDRVSISKRGDVIPAVEKVLEPNDKGNTLYQLPKNCPACKTELQRVGAHDFCPNTHCPERMVNRLLFFAGRKQMDIEHFGEKTIRTLFEEGMIRNIPDFYTCNYDALIEKEGFGEKKIALMKEAIEKSKSTPFQRLLPSLGLDELGTKAAELLIKNGYTSFKKLLALFQEGREEALLKIDGFGEKTVKALKKGFSDKENIALIAALDKLGLQVEVGKEEEGALVKNKSLEGTRWVITGSFATFKPREKAKEEIQRRGGEVVSAVSKKVTHVLVGEAPGSKAAKAEKLGLNCIDEAEFIRMLNG